MMFDPRKIAEELLSVQPMDPEIFKNLLKMAKTEEELIAEGYKPVSDLQLMWKYNGSE